MNYVPSQEGFRILINKYCEKFSSNSYSTEEEELSELMENFPEETLSTIQFFLEKDQTSYKEILHFMGEIFHIPTHEKRRIILEYYLLHGNTPSIRDKANISLCLLHDPLSISSLQKAIEKEKDELVKRYMGHTLESLQTI